MGSGSVETDADNLYGRELIALHSFFVKESIISDLDGSGTCRDGCGCWDG